MGGLVRAYFGKAKFGEGKIWYKILNPMEKCGTNFPNDEQCRNRTGEFHLVVAVCLQLSYLLSPELTCETGFKLKT